MTIIPTNLLGDAREQLRTLPARSVHTIVTSPPYWMLRSYGTVPQVWGGKKKCEHQWGDAIAGRKKDDDVYPDKSTLGAASGGHANSDEAKERSIVRQQVVQPDSNFCVKCGAWRGELGCEPRFDLYLSNLVSVFRECWRVLRDDGCLWVNMGDAYANNSSGNVQSGLKELMDKWSPRTKPRANSRYADCDGIYKRKSLPEGFKLKDMIMMPAEVALALRRDGWYLRSQIPWIKRNSMPESCVDRPATAIEYVYLLSKSGDYYYDRFAIMTPASLSSHARLSQDVMQQVGSDRANGGRKTNGRMKAAGCYIVSKNEDSGDRRKVRLNDHRNLPNKCLNEDDGREGNVKAHESFHRAMSLMPSMRNRRNSDWFFESGQGMMLDEWGLPMALVVNPMGTKIKHFASYPEALVRPMIQLTTSEWGCCSGCGTPWRRVIRIGQPDLEHRKASGGDHNGEYHGENQKDYQAHLAQPASTVKSRILAGMYEKKTVAWIPSCECGGREVLTVPEWRSGWHKARWEERAFRGFPKTTPCTVLDPFGGIRTTAMAAMNLGRQAITIELSKEYFEAANERDAQGALAL